MAYNVIGREQFKAKVLQHNKPTLLAFLQGKIFMEDQFHLLRRMSEKFPDTLQVCLVDELDHDFLSKKFDCCGSPVYLFIQNTQVQDKYFGIANNNELEEFIAKNLAKEST